MCCCVMENRKVMESTYCVKTDSYFSYNFRNNTIK